LLPLGNKTGGRYVEVFVAYKTQVRPSSKRKHISTSPAFQIIQEMRTLNNFCWSKKKHVLSRNCRFFSRRFFGGFFAKTIEPRKIPSYCLLNPDCFRGILVSWFMKLPPHNWEGHVIPNKSPNQPFCSGPYQLQPIPFIVAQFWGS